MSSAVPNTRMSEVIFALASDIEEHSDDPQSKLDSHANMVLLGSNSFVFESTWKTFNAQTLSSDIFIAKNVPIFDGALVCECP